MRQTILKIIILLGVLNISMASSNTSQLFKNPSNENILTFFFIPAPYPIDWTSPKTLISTQIKNQISNKARKLGHVNIHLSCENQEDELTGMASDNLNSKTQLIVHGAGMGILWHSFSGILEDKKVLMQEIPTYIEKNRLSFLKVKISQSICGKLKQYLKEYRDNKVSKNYGLFHRPRFGEGAGCSAFAASFLDIAQLLGDESKMWMSEILVPEKLLGVPIRDRYVPIWDVYLAERWATPDEPHVKIQFWEPDKMYQWVMSMRSDIEKIPTQAKFKPVEVAHAPGLYIDLSHVEANESPIWIQARDDRYYNFHQMLKPKADPSPR